MLLRGRGGEKSHGRRPDRFSARLRAGAAAQHVADSEDRYVYNHTFESVYSIVPIVPALLPLLIPAILMTVSIVREKELGTIINFYVTPTRTTRIPRR
jgi:ribosome-dependent ATPase